jgi:cell wall-associated NlpC family hydrolase
MLATYRSAVAVVCPALPWQILAAVGTVESANGTSTLPGVQAGSNPAGAEGPLQLQGPSFAEYAQPLPPGGVAPASPYDPVDSSWAAARMLCANGAAGGDIQTALYSYNHSPAYVAQVWQIALSYGMAADGSSASGLPAAGGNIDPGPGRTWPGDPAVVADYALSQVGVPYQWGGTTPGVGLDCSGLVYLAYRAAGITLPRVTYAQVDYGITVADDALAPGDLLFFNDGNPFGHVAIYLGQGLMIHAPHTGTVVKIDPVPAGSIELARRIIVNP